MKYITWFRLFIQGGLFTLFAMSTAWLWPLFADKQGWLPSWLSWFQTPDNSLNGDSGFKSEHRLFRNDADVDTNCIKIYINQILWLIRNPGYGFDISVLGRIPSGARVVKGDPTTQDQPQGKSGFVFVEYDNVWMLYVVKQYGTSNKCLRFRMGWKLMNEDMTKPAQIVFNLQPYKSFIHV